MIDPTPFLTPSAIKRYNKLNEWEKQNRLLHYLKSYDFRTPELYESFAKEYRISPFRDRLLEGVQTPIDPKFVENLCGMLADMQEKLEELDCSKQDISYDY